MTPSGIYVIFANGFCMSRAPPDSLPWDLRLRASMPSVGLNVSILHLAPREPNPDDYGYRWLIRTDGQDKRLEGRWHMDAASAQADALAHIRALWPMFMAESSWRGGHGS